MCTSIRERATPGQVKAISPVSTVCPFSQWDGYCSPVRLLWYVPLPAEVRGNKALVCSSNGQGQGLGGVRHCQERLFIQQLHAGEIETLGLLTIIHVNQLLLAERPQWKAGEQVILQQPSIWGELFICTETDSDVTISGKTMCFCEDSTLEVNYNSNKVSVHFSFPHLSPTHAACDLGYSGSFPLTILQHVWIFTPRFFTILYRTVDTPSFLPTSTDMWTGVRTDRVTVFRRTGTMMCRR
ncbi:hypothetical protein JOB18_016228 [Solea senegalensis]|uniref:Uncharacterized protein n=1 Tax=Solea senegalensis TaxID=28829 RepID=A0AAV6SXI2_SOLSE|nr:hypothetical protein JOB18_016228 [Solea senegalensis]